MKLSKVLYLGSYVIGIPLSGMLNVRGLALMDVPGSNPWLWMVPAYLIMFAVMFFWFHLYYRAWKSIQDDHARTTPGKAVGFLFIPFFNLYWMFPAIWGFSKDYNAFIQRHSVEAPRLPEGLFFAYVISILGWLIPGVNVLFALATLILNIPIINKICDAVNALPDILAVGEFGNEPLRAQG